MKTNTKLTAGIALTFTVSLLLASCGGNGDGCGTSNKVVGPKKRDTTSQTTTQTTASNDCKPTAVPVSPPQAQELPQTKTYTTTDGEGGTLEVTDNNSLSTDTTVVETTVKKNLQTGEIQMTMVITKETPTD